MTYRTTMTLMAAALLLTVPGHPRAQSPDCPCGDPADLVPLDKWPTDIADCSADAKRTALYGFSFAGGIVSLSSTAYGRDCQYVVDSGGLNIQEQSISQSQVDACSAVILGYAQALRDGGQVAVGDFGCNLQ